MVWKTYLVMYFGTNEGKLPSEIVKEVEKLGFKSTLGPVDFTFEWPPNEPSTDQVLELADKLSKILKGSGAIFNLDTHE